MKAVTPKRVGPEPVIGCAEPSKAEKALARRCLLYGLTVEQYRTMLTLQGGLCAICLRPPKKKALEIDHDHRTQRVRGLLCFNCNHRLLGRGLETADLHRRASRYLESSFDGRML